MTLSRLVVGSLLGMLAAGSSVYFFATPGEVEESEPPGHIDGLCDCFDVPPPNEDRGRPEPPRDAAAPKEIPFLFPTGPSLTGLDHPDLVDEDAKRLALEPKVWSGKASIDEIRTLKALCSHLQNHECRDRASAMLKGKPTAAQ